MKILGIDPGFGILGWSIIDKSLHCIDYGIIETSSNDSIENRLFEIHIKLEELICNYKPDCVSVEKLFFQKNVKTAIDVAKALGVILLTIKKYELPYHEYTPSQVKQALTGFGRASKEQMQHMIKTIFNLKDIPKPDDAADALAIAACHSFSL